jgi:hypothetical protein
VVDALAEFGVSQIDISQIDMPVTAEKIWRAIHAATKDINSSGAMRKKRLQHTPQFNM